MGVQHGGSRIALVYNFGGMCTETYTHPFELALDIIRELTEPELTKLQAEIRERKCKLKNSSDILVGIMRPHE